VINGGHIFLVRVRFSNGILAVSIESDYGSRVESETVKQASLDSKDI
jgi:hypothetical protein